MQLSNNFSFCAKEDVFHDGLRKNMVINHRALFPKEGMVNKVTDSDNKR